MVADAERHLDELDFVLDRDRFRRVAVAVRLAQLRQPARVLRGRRR